MNDDQDPTRVEPNGARHYVEDPGYPDVPDLLQREVDLPAVPVRHDGPLVVQMAPSLRGPAFVQALSTTFQHILGADPKRRRTILLGDADWLYRTSTSGNGVPWPADVPLVLEHADQIYAATPTSTANLTVITEVWAD